ncbi:MAG: GntR family transcriptional regulator, partial [Mesorhizobium sp.]
MQVTNLSNAREVDPASGRIQRSNSLVEDVYEAIFAQLMSLKIAPGSRITVDSLV